MFLAFVRVVLFREQLRGCAVQELVSTQVLHLLVWNADFVRPHVHYVVVRVGHARVVVSNRPLADSAHLRAHFFLHIGDHDGRAAQRSEQ